MYMLQNFTILPTYKDSITSSLTSRGKAKKIIYIHICTHAWKNKEIIDLFRSYQQLDLSSIYNTQSFFFLELTATFNFQSWLINRRKSCYKGRFQWSCSVLSLRSRLHVCCLHNFPHLPLHTWLWQDGVSFLKSKPKAYPPSLTLTVLYIRA